MKIALWIIAVCEVVRAVQNALQLRSLAETHEVMNKAYVSIGKSADELLSEEEYKKILSDTYLAMESCKDSCEINYDGEK